jgi:hypothetical protein
MKKVRFELSEVALNQVETVYETIKSLVKLKDYTDLETYLNTTVLSAKQYYCLLDELIMTDRLFNDIKFAKILFSSSIQHLNDEYCNIVGEPLAQTLLYDVHNLSNEMVYELFTDKETKIRFDMENINCDNVLQVLIDVSIEFSGKQFIELTELFVSNKKINTRNVNDFGKTALDLFLYRKRTNKEVFEILIKKFYSDEKKKFDLNVKDKISDYLKYANIEYKSAKGEIRFNLEENEYNRLFN